MYQIKRYANGRFYDTVEKNYVTREQISKLLGAGKKIAIIDTRTEADITDKIVSQIKTKKQNQSKNQKKAKKRGKSTEDTTGMLVQLFRKGGDAIFDYGKRYASMWQNMVTMSRDEVDKLVNMLVKDNKLSELEGSKLKKEIDRYRNNVQGWITRNIDNRLNEVLNRMNLANRDQILELTGKIEDLNKRINRLGKEKKRSTKSGK